MDRTVALNNDWYILKGEKKGIAGLISKKRNIPYECNTPFILERKFICPKQVNDTVRIFFEGEFEIEKVLAGGNVLYPEKDENGNVTYNITSALKTGKTRISAFFKCGKVDTFFFSVKRSTNV